MAGGSAHRDPDVARETAWDVSLRVLRPLIGPALFGLALVNILIGLLTALAWERVGDFMQVMA